MIQERWNSYSAREKLLLGALGALTLATLLIFGLVLPLQTAKAEARQGLEAAYQDKALVTQAMAQIGRTSHSVQLGPASNNDAFRTDVTRRAQALGLAISRLQNGAEGSVEFIFSDVAPTEIYIWLQEISGLPGGRVVNASLTGRDGRVQAVIELQGSKS